MVQFSGLPGRIDAALASASTEGRIVGGTVMVSHRGELIHAGAVGFADREASRAAGLDTIYRLASLTKAITSVTALAMADRGVLALDGAVSDWLPDFRPRLVDGREPVITLAHLLSHTAGLSYAFNEPGDGPYARAGVSSGVAEPELSLEENLRRIASVPLSYEPGKGWGYSVATDVVGAVLARAGNGSLEAVVRRYVAAPLSMTDTGFAPPPPERLAAPYANATPAPVRMGAVHRMVLSEETEIRFMPDRSMHAGAWHSAGSGLFGTAGDYLRFLTALLGGRLVAPETLAAATVDRAAGVPMPAWNIGKGHGLFSGLLVDPGAAGLPHTPGTWEWSGLYGTSWFADPLDDICVVALTNTALEGCLGKFPRDVATAIYNG